MKVWIPIAAAAAVGVPTWWASRRIWRRPPPLTEAELVQRTAPGARSAGAKIARLQDGSLLTYWELGDPNGVPLIALHGMGASGLMFSAHDEFFRARGVRCIAPNLVGGLADPPPESRLADLAATVLRLADHLRIEKFQLIAISYGTLMALGVATQAPNRVERAGLFGPMPPGSWLAEHPELAKGARQNDAALWSTARRSPALLYPMTALFGLSPTAAKIEASWTRGSRKRSGRCSSPDIPFTPGSRRSSRSVDNAAIGTWRSGRRSAGAGSPASRSSSWTRAASRSSWRWGTRTTRSGRRVFVVRLR